MLGPLAWVLILLAVILAGGFGLNFLVQDPGRLVFYYNDRVRELTLFEAAIALVVLIIAVLVALWILRILVALVRFILGDETAFSRFFARARERRGFDALAKAYLAMAAGDAKQARRKAEVAEQKLMRPNLTRILNAQAAELAGDDARARTYYRALLAEPETAFVGARGLLKLAIRTGDQDRALKLAEHARSLKPKDPETLEALYMLQSQRFDWAAARRTLTAQARAGHLQKPEAGRREAALALAQAEDAADAGQHEQARALAVEAAKLDPANTAAVTTAARALIGADSKRAAAKLLTDSWRAQPRPQIAAAFAAIEPDEAPAARRRRFEPLFALHPEHPETKFLRAELALTDRDWTGAQAAIGELRETEPSARSCAIMAAIAKGRGEPDHVVRAWLARALGAPRDEAAEIAIAHSAMLPLLVETDAPRPAERPGPAPVAEPEPEPEFEDAVVPDPAETAGAAAPEPPRRDLEDQLDEAPRPAKPAA